MTSEKLENEIQRIAQMYQDEGYTVYIHPRDEQVPSFLAGYELDLIAIRGKQKAVVAIKPTRSKLAADPNVVRIAELANREPGWRFDFVVLERTNPIAELLEKEQEPTEDQFYTMIRRTKLALEAGLNEMALIYAWTILEAVMRRSNCDEHFREYTVPTQLVSSLYSHGFLNQEDYDRANEAWDLREVAVHGFATPPIDPLLVEDVLALATKLMEKKELAVA